MQERFGKWCIWLVVATGLLVAALAGVSEAVPAIRSLCLGLGGECKETAQYVLFGMPVWVWGALFFFSVAVAVAFSPEWLPLMAAAGLGGELALVWIMVAQRLVCPICLANLGVVLLLAALALDRKRLWPSAALCLFALLVAQAAVVRNLPAPVAAAAAPLRPGDAVVARVGGEAITDAELESALSATLSELKERIFRLKQDRLEIMVRERVLALEAAARGMDVDALVAAEAKPEPVAEAEVEKLAKDSRSDLARFNWTEQMLRDRVREFLTRTRRETALRTYAASLYAKYGVRFLLTAPESPALAVEPGDSPSLGPADARVTVVEFSDYQCPACRRGHATVRAMREKYRDRVRWVFKDYPLTMHEHARPAAEAARCAGRQDRFWEMQEKLYASSQLTRAGFLQMAADLGLDREQFTRCLDEKRTAADVDRDLADVARLGLDGTPAYIVNGRLVSGTPAPDKFSVIIDQALAESAPAKP